MRPMPAPVAVTPLTSGVYHLIAVGRVVYVGQSCSVLSRVASWCAVNDRGKFFDSIEVFPYPRDQLNDAEREHIKQFDPPLNSAGRDRPYIPPAHGLTAAVIEHGSARAYLKTLPALITRQALVDAGIVASLSNAEIMAIPGFPRPERFSKHIGQTRARWRRDDVIAWIDRGNRAPHLLRLADAIEGSA